MASPRGTIYVPYVPRAQKKKPIDYKFEGEKSLKVSSEGAIASIRKSAISSTRPLRDVRKSYFSKIMNLKNAQYVTSEKNLSIDRANLESELAYVVKQRRAQLKAYEISP